MEQRSKTIVMSDVHMSNGRDYSWFHSANCQDLADMLNSIANDSAVGELVLLGDLFDLWLYPVDEVPWTVEEIVAVNPSIRAALRQCVEKIPNVYYMNGNHDMSVQPHHLNAFNAGGTNIQWISTQDYKKKHKWRHLEHGHLADMFNAPCDPDDAIGGLPLGYFITRLTATAADQGVVWKKLREFFETISEFLEAVERSDMVAAEAVAPEAFVLRPGTYVVKGIIRVLEELAEVDDSTVFRFSEPELDQKKYTVGDVKEKYGSLYDTWHAKDMTLRWRFQDRSLTSFENPDAARAAIQGLLGEALLAWGDAAPVQFAKRDDAWDFEIVMREADQCNAAGCVLASAFFPSAGQNKLFVYPKMFTQSRKEQVDTLIHEIGHIFGLRHFFAKVSETAWPSEVFGKHVPFSIMNYGNQSELTDDDKSDLKRLYQMVWSGELRKINGTPIQFIRPYHTTGGSQ